MEQWKIQGGLIMRFETRDKVRVKILTTSGYKYKYEDVIMSTSEDGRFCLSKFISIPSETIKSRDIQLMLESPKLKLRLSQKGLKLKIKILEQDESLINNLNIECGKCFLISEYSPELYNGCMLFIKGDYENSNNNKTSYEYESQEKLDEFILALRVMMKDERLQ